jgi:AcrR family transcriptional regulator
MSQARGRPTDEDKRALILDTAARLLAEGGLAGLSMEAVAAAAGVSKVTVYRAHGDRAGLLAALAARQSGAFEALQTQAPGDLQGLHLALAELGKAWLTHASKAEIRSFDLQMAAGAVTHPDVVAVFFAAGPGRLRTLIASWLRPWLGTEAAGGADELLGVWASVLPLEWRFGLPAPRPKGVQARLAQRTDMWLLQRLPSTRKGGSAA